MQKQVITSRQKIVARNLIGMVAFLGEGLSCEPLLVSVVIVNGVIQDVQANQLAGLDEDRATTIIVRTLLRLGLPDDFTGLVEMITAFSDGRRHADVFEVVSADNLFGSSPASGNY